MFYVILIDQFEKNEVSSWAVQSPGPFGPPSFSTHQAYTVKLPQLAPSLGRNRATPPRSAGSICRASHLGHSSGRCGLSLHFVRTRIDLDTYSPNYFRSRLWSVRRLESTIKVFEWILQLLGLSQNLGYSAFSLSRASDEAKQRNEPSAKFAERIIIIPLDYIILRPVVLFAATHSVLSMEFCTQGFNGYAVKYSPFFDSKLAVATAANYGLVGNGRLYILNLTANGIIADKWCISHFLQV